MKGVKIENEIQEEFEMKKKIFSVLCIGIITIGLTGCSSNKTTNDSNNNSNNYNNSSTTNNPNSSDNSDNSNNGSLNISNTIKNNKYELGETFTFDNLELTFDTTYSFTTIKNKYSEYNGQSVIRLGVNVKNISSEKNHLNMFYYDLFGSQGTQLDSISSYFDDPIDYAGDLKPGAAYKSYFYILYDGDGKYSIDFDNYSQEISVEFNINK